MKTPLVERVRQALAYEAETGILTWKSPTNRRIKQGEIAGTINDQGYRVIMLDGRRYRAHSLIWLLERGVFPPELDHVNGKRADNRIENLRQCTSMQNSQHRQGPARHSKSGILGVFRPTRRNYWEAVIVHNKKRIWLGYFQNIEDATAARRAAELKYFGEFAPRG